MRVNELRQFAAYTAKGWHGCSKPLTTKPPTLLLGFLLLALCSFLGLVSERVPVAASSGRHANGQGEPRHDMDHVLRRHDLNRVFRGGLTKGSVRPQEVSIYGNSCSPMLLGTSLISPAGLEHMCLPQTLKQLGSVHCAKLVLALQGDHPKSRR